MYALPLPSQFDNYKAWSGELDRRYRKLYQYPVSEVIDNTVEHLKKEGTDRDRQVWDAVYRELNMTKKTNDKELLGQVPFGPIGESWLFKWLSGHLKTPKGASLDNARYRIRNPDVVAREELCR